MRECEEENKCKSGIKKFPRLQREVEVRRQLGVGVEADFSDDEDSQYQGQDERHPEPTVSLEISQN